MKYCPSCRTEYLDHAERCADCGVHLLDEAAHAATEGDGGELAQLCEVADGIEADRLVGLLADEGIQARLRSNVETVHIGFAEDHAGWGEIWVPRSRLREARMLVEAYHRTPPQDFPTDR